MDAPKPKIAVIGPYFPTKEAPYRGHSAYETVRRMTQWADIHAFCPLTVYPELAALKPKSFHYRRMGLSWSPPDVPATYFEYNVLPVISRPWNGWTCLRALWPRLQAFAPDLVLNYWLYPEGWAAVAAARRLRIPSIVCTIGSDLKRIPDPFTRYWVHRTLREADFALAVSDDLRRCILATGVPETRCQTIVNGSDLNIFHPASRSEARAATGLPDDSTVILYVGSLIPPKGIRELLEAARALLPSHPKLQVVMVGEGSLMGELRAEAETGPLARHLVLPGQATSIEVARWINASDVFCLPSYSEGCPNVVIEAISCGRPVVSTTVGGIPDLIHPECGILVPPKDGPALAAALDAALNIQWDQTMIARLFSRSWEEVAAETWNVCRKLLGPA